MKILVSGLNLIRGACVAVLVLLAIPAVVVAPFVVLIIRHIQLERALDLFTAFQAEHPELLSDHAGVISLWQQTYGNLPYPSESVGWYAAGAFLATFFAGLVVVLAVVLIIGVISAVLSIISLTGAGDTLTARRIS